MKSAHIRCLVIGVALGVILVVSLFILLRSKPSEPVYQGLTLTAWLLAVENGPISWNGSPDDHPVEVAARAVRAIGTNAVPTLLGLLHARDSWVKRAFANVLKRQTIVRIPLRPAESSNRLALLGFQLIGTNAQTAVPSLNADLHANDPELRVRAIAALALINRHMRP